MYSEIVQEPKFYLDEEKHFFPEATTFLLTGEKLDYLYVLLNSKPITYFFKTFYAGSGLGENGYRYKKAFLENLPIPIFKENDVQLTLMKLAKSNNPYNDKKVNALIYRLYELNETEISLIELQ